jgi:sugar lactone lactonase YvrE
VLDSWLVREKGFPLVFPVAVAVDPHDDVYVSMVETRANSCIGYGGCRPGGFAIEKFSRSGQRLGLIRLGASLLGLGLAADGGGNLYWTQMRNHGLIEKLGPDGKIVAKWGTRGCGPGRFDRPHGLALDRQENVYVADEGNRNVQKLSPTGRPLAVWGTCR